MHDDKRLRADFLKKIAQKYNSVSTAYGKLKKSPMNFTGLNLGDIKQELENQGYYTTRGKVRNLFNSLDIKNKEIIDIQQFKSQVGCLINPPGLDPILKEKVNLQEKKCFEHSCRRITEQQNLFC